MTLDRRALVAGAFALSACGRGESVARTSIPAGEDPTYPTAAGRAPPEAPAAALRDLAPFPMGTEVITAQLDDPAFSALAARQFSQITAGYEMKMEAVVKPDGGFDFARGDRVAAFAKAGGQRLHGHTLIWYEQEPPSFQALDGKPAFSAAYDTYIETLVKRWGAVSWDVVNEPISEEGEGLRACLWSKNLGPEDYIARALHVAHAADPKATLFINEYFLETKPAKRRALIALVERLMKRGVPIGGIGTQSHLSVDVEPGLIRTAMRDLGSLGLPIHVSELDCTLQSDRPIDLRSRAAKLALQPRVFGETMEAFMALPSRQRFAFTLWGVRDKDSWLRTTPKGRDDAPLAFDDEGRPKGAYDALVAAIKGKG